jgi:hypothetical protein
MKAIKLCAYLAVLLFPVHALITYAQSKTDSVDPIQSLSFFTGNWHCDGKFATSGKSISANLVFEPILNGKFLLFKHDDEPPFTYHAWSQWGWDNNAHQFISTVQDVTGGLRLFRSPGWVDKTLMWSGGNLPDSSDQQFVFQRIDDNSFRVNYSYKKSGSWLAVDSSLCTRAGIK